MNERPTPDGPRTPGGAVRLLLPALALLGLATIASLWPDPFALDRAAVGAGQVWRLWTGHFVHLTWEHFAFDAGIGALMLLFVPWRRGLLVLPPIVGVVVMALRPDLGLYTGLSGVLHGLTALAAVEFARRGKGLERLLALGILVGLLSKSVFEGVAGVSIFTSSIDMGGVIAYEAHLVGVLGGLLLSLLPAPRDPQGHAPRATPCTASG